MRKIFAIIQARLGSSRLPGKVLFKVLDRPILEYVVKRVRGSSVDGVVVATSVKDEDSRIADVAASLETAVYRGSEDDVLDRYYRAATSQGASHIVRITADCPLIDPRVIDSAIDLYFKSGADYCSNEKTFPDGEDVEVFSYDALKYAWSHADLLSEREHVTPYIRKNARMFKMVELKNDVNLSGKRWTLDRPEDFILIKSVLEELYPKDPYFGINDVVGYLRRNPDLEKVNRHVVPAEGYIKSLERDRKIDISNLKE